LRPLLPALAKHFGLHPPALYELTGEELETYIDALDQIARSHAQKR
jgi:hypothetical protein